MTLKIVSSSDLGGVPEAVSALSEVGKLIQTGPDRPKVLTEITDCIAYMAAAHIRVDEEFIRQAPKLKLIGSPNTGKDHLELELIKKNEIAVFHIADEFTLLNSFSATSELVFGLLLALIRKIPAALQASESGIWAREQFTGFQLLGKTFGILGLGRLGEISARIAKGFGMDVIAHDVKDKNLTGVKMVDFTTLMSESDVLSIHVHLDEDTDGIINSDSISLMKNKAIIVNTSRGRIIDEDALLNALRAGSIAGAALDVIDGEWLPEADLLKHPLIKYATEHDNLFISPHIGGSTAESIYGARVFMARKMATYIKECLL